MTNDEGEIQFGDLNNVVNISVQSGKDYYKWHIKDFNVDYIKNITVLEGEKITLPYLKKEILM